MREIEFANVRPNLRCFLNQKLDHVTFKEPLKQKIQNVTSYGKIQLNIAQYNVKDLR